MSVLYTKKMKSRSNDTDNIDNYCSSETHWPLRLFDSSLCNFFLPPFCSLSHPVLFNRSPQAPSSFSHRPISFYSFSRHVWSNYNFILPQLMSGSNRLMGGKQLAWSYFFPDERDIFQLWSWSRERKKEWRQWALPGSTSVFPLSLSSGGANGNSTNRLISDAVLLPAQTDCHCCRAP